MGKKEATRTKPTLDGLEVVISPSLIDQYLKVKYFILNEKPTRHIYC